MLNYSVGTKDKIFNIVNIILLVVFALSCVYPFLYTLAASVSDGDSVTAGDVLLLPKHINIESFKIILKDKIIWTGYLNTIFYTGFGTFCSLVMTITCAYALSKKDLWGRKLFMIFIVLTMWLNIRVFGVIPFYLNIRDLHLTDSRTGIIIGFLMNAFYIVLMRTYFEGIPADLEASAKMDGASHFQILWNIYIPMSRPAIVTVGLFYAVARWNGYFWAMVLLQDENKIPLQVYLKKVLTDANRNDEFSSSTFGSITSPETISAAIIVISVIPVIMIYPFILKYFNKGANVGGVKE